jgi:hypothetical protein
MHWLATSWFSLVQTIVLVATLAVAISALRSSGRAAKASNTLAIVANNRQIWSQLTTNHQLQSVMRADMGPNEHVTESEFNFVMQVINQIATVFELVQSGGADSLEGARRDICDTMNLPVFKTVWEMNRAYRGVDFVEFMESCLAGIGLDKPVGRRPNLIQRTAKKFRLKHVAAGFVGSGGRRLEEGSAISGEEN